MLLLDYLISIIYIHAFQKLKQQMCITDIYYICSKPLLSCIISTSVNSNITEREGGGGNFTCNGKTTGMLRIIYSIKLSNTSDKF